jgi:peptidylprolyl isomerase
MAQAKDGDTVKVHYVGTLDDGTIFDSSAGRDPLEFTLGEGNVIPGFESAVRGMSPGDTVTAKIAADDAYGQREEGAVFEVDRAQLPEGLEPQVGQPLGLTDPTGQMIPAFIAEVGDSTITIDANHPLAGQDLNFEIRLVEIDS